MQEAIEQRIEIGKGNKTWEDYSFEERTCKGWLLPYLVDIDSIFTGRWDYWLDILQRKTLDDKKIPKIIFLDSPNNETMTHLRKCLEAYCCHSVRLPDFLEWLLWGFGESKERARIDDKVNEHWYRTFNLGLLLKYPHDYLGELLADSKSGRTYWNNPNGFFATPHAVVEMMTRITFDNGDNRSKTVDDCCVGTGRMLLHASNYSLRLYGQDIDRTCIMACKINGYLYAPWLVKPLNSLFELEQRGRRIRMPLGISVRRGERKVLG